MASGVQQIVTRRKRGRIVVQAFGRTGRGIKYLKNEVVLEDVKITDPTFKTEQARAVSELLESGE